MSYRGSFVTEYIYCDKCFEAAKCVLIGNSKFLFSIASPDTLPIIAGRVGGTYEGEELFDFENTFNPKLAKVICHPMRIAVLAERGERIFTVMPVISS